MKSGMLIVILTASVEMVMLHLLSKPILEIKLLVVIFQKLFPGPNIILQTIDCQRKSILTQAALRGENLDTGGMFAGRSRCFLSTIQVYLYYVIKTMTLSLKLCLIRRIGKLWR